MKFVIIKVGDMEIARLTSEADLHAHLVNEGDNVVSAGFWRDGVASGRSSGLEIASRGDADAAIIKFWEGFKV